MRVLDSHKLFYFREVARARSFRRAALLLGISQSVLTRQIQILEDDLAVILFQRGVRATRTTEAGDLLLEKCEHILGELEETRALLSSVGATPSGTVTIAMLTSFSAIFSAALLNAVRRELPDVRIRTTEGTSRYVEERLMSGQADVGVFIKRPLVENFICEDLLHEEFRLFGRGFPDDRAMWTLAEIATLPLVLPLAPYGTRRLLDEAARREHARLEARFEVDSPYLIRDLMLSSGVYAILPGTSLPAERAAGTIRCARIFHAPARTVTIGTLSGKPLSTAARAAALLIRRTVQASRPTSEEAGPSPLASAI